jgi:hypothetical protein
MIFHDTKCSGLLLLSESRTIATQEQNFRFVKFESKFNLDYTAKGIRTEAAVSEVQKHDHTVLTATECWTKSTQSVCCSLASHLGASGSVPDDSCDIYGG